MELLTVKDAMAQYGLSRKRTDLIFGMCNEVPRVPGGKKYVARSEFEKVIGGKK